MKVAVVGKSAFSHRVNGIDVPAVIAGHTVQLIRQLLTYAATRGHEVYYLYPTTVAEEDTVVFDPYDNLPEAVTLVPFGDPRFSKTSVHSGWLDLTAALTRAANVNGGLDWVILCYGFPFAPLLGYLKHEQGFRLAVLVRGGDGYKWLDHHWLQQQGPVMNNSEELRSVYKAALSNADFLGVASRWLGRKLRQHDVRFHAVIESPAACEGAVVGIVTRGLFPPTAGISVTYGAMNPEKRWMLTAGRASRDKRADLAIEVFAEAALPDWQLILSVPGPQHDIVAEQARRLKPGSVCVVTTAPRAIGALFKTCDAYIHTSIPSREFVDARPSSVTSAAYYGKPVVAPLAVDGGLTESLSSENIDAYCFDIRDVDGQGGTTRIVTLAAHAALRLLDCALRESVGLANAEHSKGSSVEAVFGRLFAHLEDVPQPGG